MNTLHWYSSIIDSEYIVRPTRMTPSVHATSLSYEHINRDAREVCGFVEQRASFLLIFQLLWENCVSLTGWSPSKASARSRYASLGSRRIFPPQNIWMDAFLGIFLRRLRDACITQCARVWCSGGQARDAARLWKRALSSIQRYRQILANVFSRRRQQRAWTNQPAARKSYIVVYSLLDSGAAARASGGYRHEPIYRPGRLWPCIS